MGTFAETVHRQWSEPFRAGTPVYDDGRFRLAVDDAAEHWNRVQILASGDRSSALVSAAVLAIPDVGAARDEPALRAALDAAGVRMNGADHLFFFDEAGRRDVEEGAEPMHVRRLSEGDGDAFARFSAAVPEQDLDDASVELDHWMAFGAFDEGSLVAVGSSYPFTGDTALADIGVVTDPAFRGRGHARAVVLALSRAALAVGYEPQYRCQLDNAASIRLAAACGFTSLGTWDVVAPEESDSDG